MREYIYYKNQKFVVDTRYLDNECCWETMIFRVEDVEINNNEVYIFRTFVPEEAMKKHSTIMRFPDRYVSEKAIQAYLKKKNELFDSYDEIVHKPPRNINVVKMRHILHDIQMFCKQKKSMLPAMLAGSHEAYFVENKKLYKRELTPYELGFVNGQHAAYKYVSQYIETLSYNAEKQWGNVYCREERDK